jgi:hypothetical protein
MDGWKQLKRWKACWNFVVKKGRRRKLFGDKETGKVESGACQALVLTRKEGTRS